MVEPQSEPQKLATSTAAFGILVSLDTNDDTRALSGQSPKFFAAPINFGLSISAFGFLMTRSLGSLRQYLDISL
jgi:hypothetical protein